LSESGVIEDPRGPDFSFSDPIVFDRVCLHDTHPAIVAPVQPLKMNERAVSQQGLFLCTNSLKFGFEFALKQVLKYDRDRFEALWRENHPEDEPPKPERLFKLSIAPSARTDMLRELHRMNINFASLFPGLDGFAQSLGTNITVSHVSYLPSPDFDSLV
jgi:hypothetical protein